MYVCMAIALRNVKFLYVACDGNMEIQHAYTAAPLLSAGLSAQVLEYDGQCALQSHYIFIAIVH